MYLYRISCFGYEDAPQRHLMHSVKFEKEEFQQLVFSAIEDIVRRWLLTSVDSVEYDSSTICGLLFSFEGFAPMEVAEILIRERGFTEMTVDGFVNFSSCHQLNRVDPHQEASNNALLDRLSAAGLLESIDRKNEEIQAHMYKEEGM